MRVIFSKHLEDKRNNAKSQFSLSIRGTQVNDIRFSDGGVLAFFRSWNLGGLLLLRSKLFLLSPAPIQANTRGGDQNMQGIAC